MGIIAYLIQFPFEFNRIANTNSWKNTIVSQICVKMCELLVHIQINLNWELLNVLTNNHEKCMVNHATIPL